MPTETAPAPLIDLDADAETAQLQETSTEALSRELENVVLLNVSELPTQAITDEQGSYAGTRYDFTIVTEGTSELGRPWNEPYDVSVTYREDGPTEYAIKQRPFEDEKNIYHLLKQDKQEGPVTWTSDGATPTQERYTGRDLQRQLIDKRPVEVTDGELDSLTEAVRTGRLLDPRTERIVDRSTRKGLERTIEPVKAKPEAELPDVAVDTTEREKMKPKDRMTDVINTMLRENASEARSDVIYDETTGKVIGTRHTFDVVFSREDEIRDSDYLSKASKEDKLKHGEQYGHYTVSVTSKEDGTNAYSLIQGNEATIGGFIPDGTEFKWSDAEPKVYAKSPRDEDFRPTSVDDIARKLDTGRFMDPTKEQVERDGTLKSLEGNSISRFFRRMVGRTALQES